MRAASRARTFLRAPGAEGERKDGRSIVYGFVERPAQNVDKTTVRERITARAAEGHVWVVQISRREVPLDAGGRAAY